MLFGVSSVACGHVHTKHQPDERAVGHSKQSIREGVALATAHPLDGDIDGLNGVTRRLNPLAEFGNWDVDRVLCGGDVVDDPSDRETDFVPVCVGWSLVVSGGGRLYVVAVQRTGACPSSRTGRFDSPGYPQASLNRPVSAPRDVPRSERICTHLR
jgi:hypothetical protein